MPYISGTWSAPADRKAKVRIEGEVSTNAELVQYLRLLTDMVDGKEMVDEDLLDFHATNVPLSVEILGYKSDFDTGPFHSGIEEAERIAKAVNDKQETSWTLYLI